MLKNTNCPQFGRKDKLGYMLGDMGNDFCFLFVGSFLTVFYTNILKLNPVHIGTLFLIAKIWDAINDPIVGIFVDSRKCSEKGKFRPWIIWFSLPVTISAVLCFLNLSNLSYGIRLIYAYVSYIFFGMMYTCMSVPYGSMASVITDDPVERTDLSKYRSMGATIAMTFLQMTAPLVLFVDNQPVASRFLIMIVIMAIVSNICYLLCYKLSVERIQHHESQRPKVNYVETLKEISRNKPILALMFSTIFAIMGASVANGMNIYLFKDYFQNTSYLSLLGLLSTIGSLTVIMGIKPIVKKFGKKEASTLGAIFSICILACLVIFPTKNVLVFVILLLLINVGMGIFTMLIWAMVADCIDYQELQTGKRQEGSVYSTYTLFRKLGSAVASSITSFSLGLIGYNGAVAVQSQEVVERIRLLALGVPLVCYAIMLLILVFMYSLSKGNLVKLQEELTIKRSQLKKAN